MIPVEQIIEADRWRMSRTLQKRQSPHHAFGGLIPPFCGVFEYHT